MLDTAVKAVKVRNSDEYSPVVWDKGLYGEGINVAVLDTGVDTSMKLLEFMAIKMLDDLLPA